MDKVGGVDGQIPVDGIPFVGREDELRHITELMSDPNCRLLTLAGPGGGSARRISPSRQRGKRSGCRFRTAFAASSCNL